VNRTSLSLLAPLLLGSILVGGTAQAADPPAAGTAAPAAAANASTDNRAVAEMLFFTARGLMEAGRVAEACAKLGESYRLDAAAGTLLNLAVCHEQEGKIASAWGEFRQALFEARKSNRADREDLCKEHIAVLEPQLPFLTITVPEGAKVKDMEILRNGVALQSGGWGTELPIDPGKVDITSRAPLYLPKTKAITIAKRQHMSVSIEKMELAPVVEMVAADSGWTTKRKVGAGLFIVGVVGIGVGTYFGVQALNQKAASDDGVTGCPVWFGELRCTPAGADASKKAVTASWISDLGFGAGAIALAAGTYLFVTGNRKEEKPGPINADQAKAQRRPTVDFAFAPTLGGAHGSVFGTF
jgi:hypothetical protein